MTRQRGIAFPGWLYSCGLHPDTSWQNNAKRQVSLHEMCTHLPLLFYPYAPRYFVLIAAWHTPLFWSSETYVLVFAHLGRYRKF